MNNIFLVRIECKDRPGIIAAVTGFIKKVNGNILDLNHHTEEKSKRFFLVCRFAVIKGKAYSAKGLSMSPAFSKLTKTYRWKHSIEPYPQKKRMAILVSKTDHCLWEMLLKLKDGYLNADVTCIISNHPDLEYIADQFGLPFYCFPAGKKRAPQEKHIQNILKKSHTDTVVLARYMQILSRSFVKKWESNIINVHHGFLPAFKGGKPYHQAWKYGVKIIGATCHYATAALDSGPIIHQDVAPVRSNLTIEEFIETGKDIERKTLIEGLKLHLEKKVFVYEGRTVIL